MSDTKEFVKEIQFTQYESYIIRKPVRGVGKIQALLRKLDLQLSPFNNKLKLTQKDIDNIITLYNERCNDDNTIDSSYYPNKYNYYRDRLEVLIQYISSSTITSTSIEKSSCNQQQQQHTIKILES